MASSPTDSGTQRLFYAIRVPESQWSALSRLQEQMREESPDLVRRARWVRPRRFHFTLRFLGRAPADSHLLLENALEEAVAGVEPFTIVLRGGGGFPPRRRPRVLWVGAEDEGRMAVIAARLERVLKTRGFPPSRKRFQAHLTLARLRRPAAEVPPALRACGTLGTFTAGEVRLYRSVLRPEGAQYDLITSRPLVSTVASEGGIP